MYRRNVRAQCPVCLLRFDETSNRRVETLRPVVPLADDFAMASCEFGIGKNSHRRLRALLKKPDHV